MNPGIFWLVLGWVPFWAVALRLGAPRRPERWFLGGVLVAFVAGFATGEMRRYGLIPRFDEGLHIPVLSLYLHEVVRFFLIGASGALAGDWGVELWFRLRKVPPREGDGKSGRGGRDG